MLTAILKQFKENQKKLPVFNTIWQFQRTYFRGWWMTAGLVTGRESCVGTGLSWKLCTASAGKSAWPLTGAPEIVNDLGGLETMWTPNKCTDHPSMKDLFIVLCPIQKPYNSNVLYKLWSYPSCWQYLNLWGWCRKFHDENSEYMYSNPTLLMCLNQEVWARQGTHKEMINTIYKISYAGTT